jgi:hypothetical protein
MTETTLNSAEEMIRKYSPDEEIQVSGSTLNKTKGSRNEEGAQEA